MKNQEIMSIKILLYSAQSRIRLITNMTPLKGRKTIKLIKTYSLIEEAIKTLEK